MRIVITGDAKQTGKCVCGWLWPKELGIVPANMLAMFVKPGTDLKPYFERVTFKCPKCGQEHSYASAEAVK